MRASANRNQLFRTQSPLTIAALALGPTLTCPTLPPLALAPPPRRSARPFPPLADDGGDGVGVSARRAQRSAADADASQTVRASSAARDGKAAAGAPRASYTFAEVAAHNTAESCWVTMDGRVYDLTGFLDDHPGGKEMLLLAAGRECTDLFRMYHWRVAGANGKGHVERQMQAHEIGVLAGPTQHPVFAPDTVGLYDELSVAVKKYFTESGATPKQCA